MKLNNIYFRIFFLLITFSNEEPIEIQVNAKSGVVNTNYNSKKKEFSFEIVCEVNKNISTTITNINISLKVAKYPINGEPEIPVICKIRPVRVWGEDSVSETVFMCTFNTGEYSFINENTILIRPTNVIQDSSTLNIAKLIFDKFDDVSTPIEIKSLTLSNIEKDYCIHNNYIFEISTDKDFKENPPLEAAICKIALLNDESHQIARCAIPVNGVKMKCSVDVEEKKYKKGDIIVIEKQGIIPCENGQAIKLPNDAKNKLEILEDCGEKIFMKNYYIHINILFLIFFNYFILY